MILSVDMLKKVWNFINQLDSQVKTIIIMILFAAGIVHYSKVSSEEIIKNYYEKTESLESKADQYTIDVAPKINECINSIQKEDLDCSDVLLLNYHNSKKSLQGIRYLYLNCIAESPKGLSDEPVKDVWNDLEYIYYQDELARIHNSGLLRINNIENIKSNFPKLYKKLIISNAKSAAFYPIEGVDSSIGMIIVLYKNPKEYKVGFYEQHIAPQIQKLSTILDYPNININEK